MVITTFANKIFNVDVDGSKNITKVKTIDRITKNLDDENFWKFWSKLGKFRQKMPFFTKLRFIQNHILRYNLSYSDARVLKYGKCMQKKKYKKFTGSRILNFWLFDFYWFFSDFFKRKANKNRVKKKKKNQNSASSEFFVLFFCINLPSFRTIASS